MLDRCPVVGASCLFFPQVTEVAARRVILGCSVRSFLRIGFQRTSLISLK